MGCNSSTNANPPRPPLSSRARTTTTTTTTITQRPPQAVVRANNDPVNRPSTVTQRNSYPEPIRPPPPPPVTQVAQVASAIPTAMPVQVAQPVASAKRPVKTHSFHDYSTPDEFYEIFVTCGVAEDIDVIVGIDGTGSNKWTGKRTFNNRHLHDMVEDSTHPANPYKQTIRVMNEAVNADMDVHFPAYMFGTKECKQRPEKLIPMGVCTSIQDLEERYVRAIGDQVLWGPTTFVPLINKAIQIVESTGKYHVLLIITDGEIDDDLKADNIEAMKRASNYPLSIVIVGVGDGPFTTLEHFDDEVKGGRFDNVQAVIMNKVLRGGEMTPTLAHEFFFRAFMEVPEQYTAIKHILGYHPHADVEYSTAVFANEIVPTAILPPPDTAADTAPIPVAQVAM